MPAIFRIFVLLVILLLCKPSLAQYQSFKMDFYGNNEGLSQSTINSIVQDSLGYLWFATQDGLNKFDGYNFITYRNNPEDTASLSDNFILSLDKDKHNNIWIGTRGGGLNKYEIRTGKFKSYQHDVQDPKSLSHNRIRCVKVASDGMIWVATRGGGLDRFDPVKETFTHFLHDENDPQSLSGDRAFTIYEDKSGTIWAGTTKGLSRYNNATNNFTNYLTNDGRNSYVRAILEDRTGRFWVATYGGGLKLLDRKSGVSVSFKHDPQNSTSIGSNDVFALLEDRKGNIWVGTRGGYLNKLNAEKKTFHRVGVSNTNVRSLYEDNAGNIWVGLRVGMNRFNNSSEKFRYYKNSEIDYSVLTNNNTFAVLKDSKNRVWVGSFRDGISVINQETGESIFYKADGKTGLTGNDIRSIFEDSKGRIWVGTRHHGLNLFNDRTQKFTPYKLNDGSEKIEDISVNHMYEDSHKNIWFCTFSGLRKLNHSTNKIIPIVHEEGNVNSLYTNASWSIIEDHKGDYWIGLYAAGFDHLDTKTGVFTHYENNPDNPKSLANNGVSYVYEDSSNNLWISIYGGGLDKLDRDKNEFKHYGRKQGLSNTALYSLVEDNTGNLWMSHNMGISKFNPSTNGFTNYSITDGLPGNEFNSGAFTKSKDGEILFGGQNGVVMFYPDKLVSNPVIPEVHINKISLFNKELEVSPGSVLDSLPEFDNYIVLDYNQGYVSFDFVALNYSNTINNKYKYRLEGFDDNWINAGSKRHANYTNLPPGKFVFRVIGSNNDGLWNTVGDQITIVVKTPWWKKIWFRILLIITFACLLYLGFKIRIRAINNQKLALEKLIAQRTSEIEAQKQQLSSKNEELVHLNEEKNELINIVSHDLRSPLNQVKGLVNIIQMTDKSLSKETSRAIHLIDESVERLRLMVRRILDVNAIESKEINLEYEWFDLEQLVKYVVDNFLPIAVKKEIQLVYEPLNKEVKVNLDRNYVIQILENIISNALKFSDGKSEVEISIKEIENKVQVHIKDHGPGISEQEKKLLFTRYKKLSSRPTGGEDSTGIGLSIVKKYMEAMNGKVWCESELGSGSTFIVEFNREAES